MYEWNFFDDIPEFHPIADANTLYDAFQKSRKGSHWKGKVQKFRWNEMSEIRKLQKELVNYQNDMAGAYKLSPYSKFEVNERGKIRAITALDIRDRVVKHALNDVMLLPKIRPHLIYDNGASLEGRGVSFTRKRLIAHLESYYRETGSNKGYIMIMDFSGYYDNIDHEEAMSMIRKYVPDAFARKLVWQAYDSYKIDVSFMTDEEFEKAKHSKFSMVEYRRENRQESELTGQKFLHRSLSVGDQTSQITAISFPTPLDNLVKIVNGCKYYARYMDDIYIIGQSLEELRDIEQQIYAKAKELKLIVNPRKTRVMKLSRTFTFLQFKYFLCDNGHVVVRINPKTVHRMRKKLKKLKVLVDNGDVRFIKVENLFKSWIATYSRYMSKKQLSNMIALYQCLFGGGLNKWMSKRNIA